jgi:DNA-binding transcriptional regulator LsrR (DeoR family)
MDDLNKKALENIEGLLKHILAVQLYQAGVGQQLIAKHLKIATAKANELLKGIEKGKRINENAKPQNSK